MRDKVIEYFNNHRAEIEELVLEITDRLVRQRTVNAGKDRLSEFPYLEVPGQERLAADVVAEYFERWGIPFEIHEGAPGRANIIGNLSSGSPVLMMGCHLDVVPPGEGWDSDPWVVTRREGLLVGRGVLDNKGPLASSMAAAWILKESGVSLNGTFQIAGIASEEFREPGEQDPGIEYLLDEKLIAPDMAVIPDIGENMKMIDIAEKGRAVFKIVTSGRQAHGSTPERGINAVNMLARVLTALEELDLPHEVHPVLGSPSMNLGVVRGGEAANTVPAKCEALVDVRFVPGQSTAGLIELFRATAEQAISGYSGEGVGVEVTVDTSTEPHAIDAALPLVKAVQSSVAEVLGFEPEPFGIGGGTFAKSFNLGGIPAVGFGPGADDQFHVVNEHIEVKELVDFSLVAALMACDLLT